MTNPLLAKVRLPGVTFRMPSQGLFYHNDELDSSASNGEVEVFPLTTLDEFTLSVPDKLMSGKAIEEVFARCVPQVKKPLMLLAKDVDYLMVALRQVSFGDEIDVTYRHSCEKAREQTYTVNIDEIIRKSKQIDPTAVGEIYVINLPNGQIIKLKPMNYGDIVNLMHEASKRRDEPATSERLEQITTATFVSVIESVDDVTDRDMIGEWLRALPLKWKGLLEEKINAMTDWGTDFMVDRECRDCKQSIQIQVAANPVSFFT